VRNIEDLPAAAAAERDALARFLGDIVAIESLSGGEQKVIRRIAAEMETVGFDEVRIDPLGNVLGRVGDGPRVVACDAHIDTVDVGDRDLWSFDPYCGTVTDERVLGRGAADQKAGLASMVYAGKLLKERGLTRDCQVWMTGTVMEEDCDGLCWHYLLQEGILKPELVVSTEPTGLRIHRGHRGRLEIRVTARGRSCHASAPERGDNAVVKLAPACAAIAALNDRLPPEPTLGKGSAAVTWFGCDTPSLCAVPDKAELHIDRRLTLGETKESAVREVRDALRETGVDAEVWIPTYAQPSWTGLTYPMEKYFPTWLLPEDHPALAAARGAGRLALGREPETGVWTFSTNGVAINGLHGVPCLGFGPGHEEQAHAPDEFVRIDELVSACAFYAALPSFLSNHGD